METRSSFNAPPGSSGMSPLQTIARVLPCVLLAGAVMMTYWLRAPWVVLGGMGLLLAVMVANLAGRSSRSFFLRLELILIAFASFLVLGGAILQKRVYGLWTFDNVVIVWLVALALGTVIYRMDDVVSKKRWRVWFLIWAFAGAVLWLGTTYLENQRGAFYAGLLICLILLVLCKYWFRSPALCVRGVNTLILVVVGFPAFSLLLAPSDQLDWMPTPEEKPYSYEAARKDPAAYARWWRYCRQEGSKLFAAVFTQDGNGKICLRSNTVVTFGQGRVAINSKGFRGPEIPDEKNGAYRIVALGESTTFGLTMSRDNRPWPELLEQMIVERLNPLRPVQVINAGVPSSSLEESLERLSNEIIALEPDMIISYHGINGFPMIYSGMPPTHGKPPPTYQQRPVTLLADFEYQMRVRHYRRQYSVRSIPRPAFVSSPMETKYAKLYEQLAHFTRTNSMRLVLATFSMAANEQSLKDVVDFYRMTSFGAEWQMKANRVHSDIVRQLARDNPEVLLVDTSPVLDGRKEYFFDLVHFTEVGEAKMAKIFFEGIKEVLKRELARTNHASAYKISFGPSDQGTASQMVCSN